MVKWGSISVAFVICTFALLQVGGITVATQTQTISDSSAISPQKSVLTRKNIALKRKLPMVGETSGMNTVKLTGSPYERGLQHGRVLKDQIVQLTDRWKEQLADEYSMPADQFLSLFVNETHFTDSIEKHAPSLLEEVRGISDGSGVAFNTIYVLQLMDEEWYWGQRIVSKKDVDDPEPENSSCQPLHPSSSKSGVDSKLAKEVQQVKHHCTGLALTDGKRTLAGQNMDIPGVYHGYQTLLHIVHEGGTLESFVLTFPGMIGLTGVNSASVGVTVNTLPQLRGNLHGLPVAFVVRASLERRSGAESRRFLKTILHASGQNYIVSDPTSTVSLESSEHTVCQFPPADGKSESSLFKSTFHTNHPLANSNLNKSFRRFVGSARVQDGHDPMADISPGSAGRLKAVVVALKGAKQQDNPLDEKFIRDVLAIHKGRAAISNFGTFGCVIFRLSQTEPPLLFLAPGVTHLTPFHKFAFQPAVGKL
eukprot:CAMPEP_0175132138 /NCGR_PEP_ID=MMETSP0087-20121206/6916_1 /TAXON_ID=136419 /ORGANISM="Unknown Unknown, Strain D1" /LENGTH=479 /DNA_ID=CAMNT_0016414475 /DNA_START=118 /DNA_END=1557 /DNA_ORIENTATION=+